MEPLLRPLGLENPLLRRRKPDQEARVKKKAPTYLDRRLSSGIKFKDMVISSFQRSLLSICSRKGIVRDWPQIEAAKGDAAAYEAENGGVLVYSFLAREYDLLF